MNEVMKIVKLEFEFIRSLRSTKDQLDMLLCCSLSQYAVMLLILYFSGFPCHALMLSKTTAELE